ncbi:MAG TPA: PLP-dependent aminotransferase family protein [Patescibacteria group bacterium]|nr:PLP-dependent aminotransferase family protein [Patescibacteria group bacterium]
MTIWQPELRKQKGPRYLAIAEALAEDIRSARLEDGQRLPTHRDLADHLGVTVGTVSRAYAEAQRRGLIRGEVGRGTFVREATADELRPSRQDDAPGAPIDLSLNFPMGDIDDRLLAGTLAALSTRRGLSGLLEYQPHGGSPRHRAAGAAWINRAGLDAVPEQVLVTSGAQHAMAVVLATMTSPGDKVLTERLTYPGVKTLCDLLHLELRGVDIDDEGIRPDAFDKACRALAPRVLYCTPTIQNPTATVMPEGRRRKIAAIAQAHGVIIVEDDIYGFLSPKRPRPLCVFARDNGFYISSLSKSVAPGLRIAYLLSPGKLVERVTTGIRSTTWMAAPLMAEIASIWIGDGSADASLDRKRTEAAERQKMAVSILGAGNMSTHPYSYHVWLRLPEPWKAASFVNRAWQRGVIVSPSETFAVGGNPPEAVRVCLGATRTRSQLEKGLRILTGTIEGPTSPDLSIL